MQFIGMRRVISVSEDYVQIKKLGEFWEEINALYPNEELYGLGTNWQKDSFEYYIGKIDQEWQSGLDSITIPDENWHEFKCNSSDNDIEVMYRMIYDQGTPDYEIESISSGVFTTKVHFKTSKGKTL